MSITLSPAALANRLAGGLRSAASTLPSRTHCQSGGALSFAGSTASIESSRILVWLMSSMSSRSTSRPCCFRKPVVEARMRSFGADFLAVQINQPIDTGIRAHDELMVYLIDGLTDVDPAIPPRAMTIGGDMISADEFHVAGRYRAVRLGRGDMAVVVYL